MQGVKEGAEPEESKERTFEHGAHVLNDHKSTSFNVWAPLVSKMELVMWDKNGNESILQMKKRHGLPAGHYTLTAPVGDATRYSYVLDQKKRRPDPASKYQPDGVHGPSQVVDDSAFNWTDHNWKGIPMEGLVIYELHVGTFTPQGNFESLIPWIDYLKDLGVTAIELMPVAQFPGARNWGYDGVYLFAPQNSYGGPDSLKNFVNSCHNKEMAVILDVVYNHVGPEGNYLQDFGPYFSYKYHTPWGPSFNYDDRGCDEVRTYIISNALYWVINYHFDGLRLDAVHGIFDYSPKHILIAIKDAVESKARASGREINIIAESDLNDPRIVRRKEECGFGLDAQWSDDFHHSVHAFLTGERFGYYQDFGNLVDIAKSLKEGFVYDGKYSTFRGRRHGASSADLQGKRFVVSIQNHDQVGNRPDGARIASLLKRENTLKVAAGLLILGPYVPLLFMGEEYGETAPFYYFVSHSDQNLMKAVKEGRMKEFEAHNWQTQYVYPGDEQTFAKSKLNHDLRNSSSFSRQVFSYYRELIMLRKSHPALAHIEKRNLDVMFDSEENLLLMTRSHKSEELALLFNLGSDFSRIPDSFGGKDWKKMHDSNAHPSGAGNLIFAPEILKGGLSLPPFTVAVYRKES